MNSDADSIKKCFTNVKSASQFQSVWIDDSLQVCLNFVNSYSFRQQTKTRELFDDLFNRVMPSAFSSSGQETAVESYIKSRVCIPNPGICELALTNACALYTRTDAEGNGNVRDFCGCHLQESEYSKYTDTYRSSLYCDPICANSFTIQSTDFGGTKNTCNQSFCIIDGVTIDIIQSRLGDITFDQICGGCGGNCVCSINNSSISVFDSQVGEINLSQECQGGLSCFDESETGGVVGSGCVGSLANEDSRQSQSEITEKTIVQMSLATIIIFTLVLLVVSGMKKTKSQRENPATVILI